MKLGLLLTGDASSCVHAAQRAEAAGFDSVWAVDFQTSNALVRLAAIAANTDRIKLGTGIAAAFTRSPLVLGTGALDIDALSGGRLSLGLGTGLERMNQEWYGVEHGKPRSRVIELIALLRKLLITKGPGFAWPGDSWQLNIPAYQRPDIARDNLPILLAGVNRRMIEAAGEHADGLIGHPVHTKKWHREVTQPLLAEAASRTGRPLCPIVPHLITSIQSDVDQARADAKIQIGFSFSVEHYHSILDLHGLRSIGQACRAHLAKYDFKAMAQCIPDDLVDEIALVCTPDEAAQRLAQWQEFTDQPILFPASIGVAPERFEENLSHVMDLARHTVAQTG